MPIKGFLQEGSSADSGGISGAPHKGRPESSTAGPTSCTSTCLSCGRDETCRRRRLTVDRSAAPGVCSGVTERATRRGPVWEQYEWPLEYWSRQDLAYYINENQSYVEDTARMIAEEHGCDLVDDIWTLFLRRSEARDSPTFADEKILNFAKGATLNLLQGNGLKEAGERKAVILDQRCRAGHRIQGTVRQNARGKVVLTAAEAYQELQKKRFRNKPKIDGCLPQDFHRLCEGILFPDLLCQACRSASQSETDSGLSGAGDSRPLESTLCDISCDITDCSYAKLNGCSGDGTADDGGADSEPDVERRIFCTYNPDKFTFLALAATVSGTRQRFLPQVIEDYLLFVPALKIYRFRTHALPSRTLPNIFAFHFNFPFYAWRRSTRALKDDRLSGIDGPPTPIRKHWNMSFLTGPQENADGERLFAFVYQASLACLLVGQDHAVWDAYGFFESYFDEEEDRRDFDYYDEVRDETTPDLMTWSESCADYPIWLPREYFLKVLVSRVRQVERETVELAHRFGEGLADARERTFRNLQARSGGPEETPAQRNEKVTRMTHRAKEVLTQVKRTHCRNTKQLKDLLDGPIAYFVDLEHPEADQWVVELRDLHSKMITHEQSIEELEQDCEQTVAEFETHMRTEDNEKLDHQRQDSMKTMLILLISTVVFLPLGLTASLFNVPDILEFPVNRTNYLIANAILISTLIILLWFLTRVLSSTFIRRIIFILSWISGWSSTSNMDDLDAEYDTFAKR